MGEEEVCDGSTVARDVAVSTLFESGAAMSGTVQDGTGNAVNSKDGEEQSITFLRHPKLSGGLRSTLSNVICDWAILLTVSSIPHGRFSRCPGDDDQIKHVLQYVFQPGITQLLAWGTIWLRVRSDWKLFTGVIRKISAEKTWRYYKARADVAAESSTENCGRSTFHRLVNVVVRGEQKRREFVD